MPCLDTNFLIEIIRGNSEAIQKAASLQKSGSPIKTTSVNACELYKGAYKSARPEENINEIESMLSSITLLNFDPKSAKIAAMLMEDLRAAGQSLSAMDIMIAAITLENNETLLTKDIEHFKRIKELRIETW
jgi:predicted nucleic acid-binding protein